MPEDRLNMRLDVKTIARLAALAAKLELKRPDLIRQAVKRMAEQEGVEGRGADSS
jgi:predicted transcriptional regulator